MYPLASPSRTCPAPRVCGSRWGPCTCAVAPPGALPPPPPPPPGSAVTSCSCFPVAPIRPTFDSQPPAAERLGSGGERTKWSWSRAPARGVGGGGGGLPVPVSAEERGSARLRPCARVSLGRPRRPAGSRARSSSRSRSRLGDRVLPAGIRAGPECVCARPAQEWLGWGRCCRGTALSPKSRAWVAGASFPSQPPSVM